MIQKELAVEMIHLVRKGAREQVGRFENEFLPVDVQAAQHDFFRPNHGCRETGNTQTAFFFKLLALDGDDLRIEDREQAILLFPARGIRHQDSFGNTDLRGSQTDTRRLVHGFDHVLDQLEVVAGDVGDGIRRLFQDFRTPKNNRPNHIRNFTI